MDPLGLLIRIVLALVVLKLVVWWLEPRMAFFPLVGVQETPAVANIPYRDVRVETADGETLHAWWLERKDARAQVVFFHGNGGNLSLWLDILIEMWRRRLSVLAVDYRGYGASTGRPSERGLYRDAESVVRAFDRGLKRPDAPVVYWGRSIGAPVAAHAATIAAPDGLVLETPFPEVRAVLRANPVLWALSFLSSYRFGTSALLERVHVPLLVVHGDADEIVPFAAGRAVFERARSVRKAFVAIPRASHNNLHVVDPQFYWRSVDEFLASLPAR